MSRARLVISTHLDDAVFSCYSVFSPETTVATVFAAIPPPGRVGGWDREGGALDSHIRAHERREEDRHALLISRAEAVHLDFADGQYANAGMLPRPDPAGIRDSLKPLLDDAEEVYAPAGIGNDEHAFVRDVVLSARADAILYADLPYALKVERGGFNLPSSLGASTRLPSDVYLDSALLHEKLEAVRAYRSQLRQLVYYFGNFIGVAGLGRERFWRAHSEGEAAG